MRLSNWLYRVVNGWIALLALFLFIAFTVLVLPQQSQKVDTASSEAGTPDTSFYYSPEELYQMADSYGERGRQAYIQQRFTFDIAWPFVYTFFLVTAITWLYEMGFPEQSGWRRANIVPFIAVLLDFLENLSTSLVMSRYPQSTPIIDWLAPMFTSFKWVFVVISFLLLLVGVVVCVRQSLTRRQPA